MSDDIEKIKKETFSNHVVDLEKSEMGTAVQTFRFAKPDTGMYSMQITCGVNLITITGDCYSLMVTPGYGRSGLGFLRGSITSVGYFLEKVPYELSEGLKGFSNELATEYIGDHYKCKFDDEDYDFLEDTVQYMYDKGTDECVKDELTAALDKYLEEEIPSFDNGDVMGLADYYNHCYMLDIDEPSDPTQLKPRVYLQLAGLRAFVEYFDTNEEKLKEALCKQV